jgi:hypothetical protein
MLAKKNGDPPGLPRDGPSDGPADPPLLGPATLPECPIISPIYPSLTTGKSAPRPLRPVAPCLPPDLPAFDPAAREGATGPPGPSAAPGQGVTWSQGRASTNCPRWATFSVATVTTSARPAACNAWAARMQSASSASSDAACRPARRA